MSKKSSVPSNNRRAIRDVLHEFVSHDRSNSATPDEVSTMIADRVFKGISEGAFRFPSGIKAIRKSENSN
jgi:hypothetical protein